MTRTALFAAMVLLSGCASLDPYAQSPIADHLQREDDVGYCARLFADVDRRVDRLQVRDAEAEQIGGFPYLRVDRFTAARAPDRDASPQRRAWWLRLSALDEERRTIELANADLAVEDLSRCRQLLAAADDAEHALLVERAVVPDRYSVALRAVGLYPLTRLPFAAGIARWQQLTRTIFDMPFEELPTAGQVLRYGPSAAASVQPRQGPWPLDALGVPQLSAFERNALLARHAPLLDIDVAGHFDAPGAVRLGTDAEVEIDTAHPTVYTRIAHTVFEGRVHLQLVYTVWFSERPPAGWFDLLAGKLDALIWRVTLDTDGEPLVYDSIHACGCYHLFFPTLRLQARPAPDTLDEGLFVPQRVPALQRGERVALRVASGTHYLQRIRVEPPGPLDVHYRLEDERRLTTLPRPAGGTRSAYGHDGLVAGSERAESLLFWPMGIVSAGQMRQWGHHATAFVGRRHFDDPRLFDAYFERR